MQTWNNLSYRVCGVGGLVYCFRWGVPPSSAGNQLLADLLKVILCEQSPLVVPARSLKNLFGEYQTKALLVILLPFFLWTAHLPYICVFWAPLLGKEECWVKPDHKVTDHTVIFHPCICVFTLQLLRFRSYIRLLHKKFPATFSVSLVQNNLT